MKKMLAICALAALCLLTGCDFFRTLAGRPTSADIAAKRALIERQEQQEAARRDSIERVRQQILADSLAVMQALAANRNLFPPAEQVHGYATASLPYRYYILVGTFSNADNANRVIAAADKAGLHPARIPYGRLVAVGVCPSNSLVQVYHSLEAVRQQPFCPKDAWILAKTQ
ncbi:MAG: hypothetical protein IJU63_03910 [Bacteroidales bacterium]|nr:hypothetical protein [Bacteroidales bacterium]